jgi:hypothetical protein
MERTEILKDTRLFLRDFGRQTFEIYIETVALFAIELFVRPARSWKSARGKSKTSNIIITSTWLDKSRT